LQSLPEPSRAFQSLPEPSRAAAGAHLLRVEVRGRLVDEVDVRRLAEREHDRSALELAAREVLHLVVDDAVHVERLHNIRRELRVDVPAERNTFRSDPPPPARRRASAPGLRAPGKPEERARRRREERRAGVMGYGLGAAAAVLGAELCARAGAHASRILA